MPSRSPPAADEESFASLAAEGQVPLSPRGQDAVGAPAGGIADPLAPDSIDAHRTDAQWCRANFSQRNLRKLAKARPGKKVDFHGETKQQAWRRLNDELRDALRRNITTVELVHGKGEGVLKGKVRAWLAGSKVVLAYSEPPGNDGSVIARLKSSAAG